MKMRNTLSGIAALLLVGVFYSFAFCVVEDIDDAPISMDFYYSTETDADTGKEQGKATSVIITDSTSSVTAKAEVTEKKNNETAVPSVVTEPETEAITEEPITQPVIEEKPAPEADANENMDESAVASQQQVFADESANDKLLSKLDSTAVVTTVPEESAPEEDTATVFEVPGAEEMIETPVGESEDESYSEYTEESIIETIPVTTPASTFETVPVFTEDTTAVTTEPIITVTTTASVTVPDIIITLDTTAPETTTLTLPSETTASATVSAAAENEMFTVKYGGSNHTMNAFDLTCLIVNNEVSSYFSDEAIKAQAVAAYSYVKYHNENGLVPSVLVRENPPQRIIDMVSSVWGKCCYYQGKTAQTVYMASSSGYTASSKNVWGGHFDYLVSVECPFDSESDPNYGKVVRISQDGMKSAIERYFGITLSANPENWIKIRSYIDGNYVNEIDIDGQTTTTGRKMRESVLGFEINSASFDVYYSDGIFTFTTYGWGHGVGMSQNGANILAKQGYTYDQILKYYYTGIDVL
ncbi:MAG: SpoIID/LytB domain-containing protein [Oscillospiraceae bacterium]|nr:SpoIID/LytB domain-containing protein [Oscillospiraceae bacterium]